MPRPSSPPGAKASTRCPSHTHIPSPTNTRPSPKAQTRAAQKNNPSPRTGTINTNQPKPVNTDDTEHDLTTIVSAHSSQRLEHCNQPPLGPIPTRNPHANKDQVRQPMAASHGPPNGLYHPAYAIPVKNPRDVLRAQDAPEPDSHVQRTNASPKRRPTGIE